ncbi:MAG TPA: tetratricopeptide repeat protein [Polyangia bacterium]|jgi:tetratricopeptide (TPR) repeat protein
MRGGAVLACLFAAGVAAAAADPPPAQSAGDRRAAYTRAMARAADLLEGARQSAGPRRERLVGAALDEYERAARLLPEEPDPHYQRGLVQADFLHQPLAAIAAWRHVRALDPSYVHDPDMAFKLALELSRVGQFEAAIAEYDRCRGYRHEVTRSDIVLGNSAEAAMGAGLLDEAIRRYRLALAVPAYDAVSTALHLYGLAVALDRDEQVYAAREVIRRALAIDPGRASMEPERGVFFVPDGDRHYYDGLALAAAGHVGPAREAFELFLLKLPQSRYAARARAHLRDLARAPRGRPAQSAAVSAVGLKLTGPLREAPVVSWLSRALPELAACPAPPGVATIAVRASADRRGRLADLRVTGGRRELVACARGRIAAWHAPSYAAAGPATIAFTLIFTPQNAP